MQATTGILGHTIAVHEAQHIVAMDFFSVAAMSAGVPAFRAFIHTSAALSKLTRGAPIRS